MSTLALGAVATDLLLNRSRIEVSRRLPFLFCLYTRAFSLVLLWNRIARILVPQQIM